MSNNPEGGAPNRFGLRVLYRIYCKGHKAGGERISPASLRRQEEDLPSAKPEQWCYNKAEMSFASLGGVYIGGRREFKSLSDRTSC